MTKQTVILAGELQRKTAMRYVAEAPIGYRVEIKEPKRTDGQNERFHAICGDIAKSGLPWAGKPRSAVQWKVLLVSGHAKATGEEFDMVPGLEGEFINLRESTALMSVRRGSSLIEYATAFAQMNNVLLWAAEEEHA
ncbi:MAG: recombinase [Devosia sp.]|uniref:recombination protein NinB n=1 Tax=Devosia sp. TaxID=1871048 RepID=UPI00260AD824|nr:recombination protein NinB [Devosia sp.]MDB5541964.1 recombinase [Devosia sp.]